MGKSSLEHARRLLLQFESGRGRDLDMLAEPCRVGDIFRALQQRHEVDENTMIGDVGPFLQALLDQQLARVVASGEER